MIHRYHHSVIATWFWQAFLQIWIERELFVELLCVVDVESIEQWRKLLNTPLIYEESRLVCILFSCWLVAAGGFYCDSFVTRCVCNVLSKNVEKQKLGVQVVGGSSSRILPMVFGTHHAAWLLVFSALLCLLNAWWPVWGIQEPCCTASKQVLLIPT